MKFRNLDGSGPQPFGSVFKWAVIERLNGSRRPDATPFEMPRVENDGQALRENVGEPWLTWGGFVIAGDGRRVYHSGDTAYFEGFRQIGERPGPIDIALLPI